MKPHQNHTKSVCIIGAGAAGLCALRHFTEDKNVPAFNPIVCFEQTDQIGGTWVYSEQVGTADRPVHSSMYRDMRVNGPVQIMDYPDFPFQSEISYTHHSQVLQYLHDYAAHFGLLPHIRFRKNLLKISKTEQESGNGSWLVSILDQQTGQAEMHPFDVIVLSPGRYSAPKWPHLEGLSLFCGSVIHSHDYRSREPYSGKRRVMVVGAGPSGVDMALDVASVACEVLFLNRSGSSSSNLPANVVQVKGEIDRFTGPSSVSVKVFEGDGEVTFDEFDSVDAVILATGYRLSTLAFLDLESCGLQWNEDEDTVEGIYRHLINIRQPSMALLSVCKPTLSFPLYHQQILYFIKTLLGTVRLPTQEQMQAEVRADMEHRRTTFGLQPKDRHLLKSLPLMRAYFELLERDGRLEPTRPVVYRLLEEIVRARTLDPVGYKEINYSLIDDQRFEVVEQEVSAATAVLPLSQKSQKLLLQKGG